MLSIVFSCDINSANEEMFTTSDLGFENNIQGNRYFSQLNSDYIRPLMRGGQLAHVIY